MNAGDERGTKMKRHARLIACLAVAVLATSCTVYEETDHESPRNE